MLTTRTVAGPSTTRVGVFFAVVVERVFAGDRRVVVRRAVRFFDAVRVLRVVLLRERFAAMKFPR
jgi:hypothetical protein